MAVAVVCLLAVRDLLQIRADIDQGRARLSGLDLDSVRAVGLEATIADGADALDRAAIRADDSMALRVLAAVPLVSTQVDGITDLTDATAVLGDEARISGSRIQAAIDGAGSAPTGRIDLLDTVVAELDRLDVAIAAIDIRAEGRLVGPVAQARASLAEELDEVPGRLIEARAQVDALRELLVGPSTYLLMAGNNAEMRAGAGMPLSAGLASIGDGDVSIGDLEATELNLYVPEPTGQFNADIPDVIQRTYPSWSIGETFPETAVLPDFSFTAPIYADIGSDTRGWDVDGAIHIDAVALAMMLDVVGPIDIGGVRYDSQTAPSILLNEIYIVFDGVNRQVRRNAQSELAKALFEAIEERDIDLLDLVDVLQRAGEGRHLMVWSRDPVVEDLFQSFGVGGTISAGQTLVSVQNTSANKLDWYIRPSVVVAAEPLPSNEWEVTLTTTVDHPDRELTVPYIEGPFPELAGGTHRALVTVQVPASATQLEMPGRRITEFGSDGTAQVIGTRVVVARGESAEIVTTYRLPRDFNAVVVAPSARVEPVPWTVAGSSFDDATGFFASFGPFPDYPPDNPWNQFALGAVLVAAAGLWSLRAGTKRDQREPSGVRLARIDSLTGASLLVVAVVLASVGVVLAG